MRKNWVVGLLVVVISGAIAVQGADPKPVPAGADAKEFQRMVQEEVQRQLPPLVKAEVKRQIEEIIANADKENRVHARTMSAASTLQTIRSQLELYKIQHRDRMPSLAELENWKALVNPTDELGHFEGQTKLGPYIQHGPANPFTDSSTVVGAGTATVKDGWSWDEKKETLRIVLPEGETEAIRYFGSAVEVVKGTAAPMAPAQSAIVEQASATASMLQTMRGQLELYKIQHADRAPTWNQMADWGVLIHKTDGAGNQGRGEYGPYIAEVPVNPFNGSAMIVPAGAANAQTGWTYAVNGGFRVVVTAEQAKNAAAYLGKEDMEISK